MRYTNLLTYLLTYLLLLCAGDTKVLGDWNRDIHR